MTQTEKANRFRALHQRDGIFLIPNPWDAGSARMFEGLGFEALATSSAAFAATLGRRDGKVTRDEVLAHVRQLVQAANLPVSADLENGFADDPAAVAETFRLAAEAGLVGGSIEDSTHETTKPLYDLGHATERVAAAVAELAAAGVKRVSFAGSLYRAAITGLLNAAREIKSAGSFNFLEQTMTSAELNPFLG